MNSVRIGRFTATGRLREHYYWIDKYEGNVLVRSVTELGLREAIRVFRIVTLIKENENV